MEDHSLPQNDGVADGALRGALLALWLAACVRGEVSPDDFVDAVRGDDPRHLVNTPEGVGGLLELLPLARAAAGLSVAVAAPGDLVGLAGPAHFNHEVVDAGSAVLLTGTGLGVVAVEDARTIVWQVHRANAAPVLDPAEADRQLRAALTTTATTLAELDVSRWAPEIPDLLLNADHRPPLHLPPGLATRRRVALERATLCLDAVALAPHHPALADLARAARRGVAAICSDSLGAS